MMNKRIYNLHDQKFDLEENEVHIWNFDLDKINSQIEQLEKILSNDELIRADKFHFEIDKVRYICSRGLLRILLRVYSGLPPKEINFTFNDYGKPSLSTIHNNPGLHFNLSHSKQFMSVGFVKDALIGMDVELMTTKGSS
jgi:4'-phosphopantetheinyl transferase